jgi:hypothetical protein
VLEYLAVTVLEVLGTKIQEIPFPDRGNSRDKRLQSNLPI